MNKYFDLNLIAIFLNFNLISIFFKILVHISVHERGIVNSSSI